MHCHATSCNVKCVYARVFGCYTHVHDMCMYVCMQGLVKKAMMKILCRFFAVEWKVNGFVGEIYRKLVSLPIEYPFARWKQLTPSVVFRGLDVNMRTMRVC